MDNQPTDGRVIAGAASTDAQPPASNGDTEQHERIPVFGARRKARELATEVVRLRSELDRLGALSVVALEQRRVALATEVETETARLEQERRDAAAGLERDREEATARSQRELGELADQRRDLDARVGELRTEVVKTEELAMLQEVGVYEYRHPLSDSVAYQAELKRLRDQIKAMAKASNCQELWMRWA